MDIESCVNRIWEVVLDSYGSNVYLRDDEAVVYESLWEKEMKVRIRVILEKAVDEANERIVELERQATQIEVLWRARRS